MQTLRPFEADLARRLRNELDAVEVRAPARLPASRARVVTRDWVRLPLAVALVAALALGALAAAVTRSADPALWVQPASWQRALGEAPPTPAVSPTPPPSTVVEQPETPEAAVTTLPSRPEADSSDSQPAGGQQRSADSPDSRTSGEAGG
jgi:hypothetical protein